MIHYCLYQLSLSVTAQFQHGVSPPTAQFNTMNHTLSNSEQQGNEIDYT